MALITFIAFAGFLLAGVPIAFSMASAAVLGIYFASPLPLTLVLQRLFVSVDSFSLMAIPLFMLAGELMTAGGISIRLVRFAQAAVGHLRGGLGQVSILTSVIFAGVSGSAAADTAAVGSITLPAMSRENYPRGLAATLQAMAGSLGPIIPPSLTMIIFASLTGVSVSKLFIAGIVPGLLIAVGLMALTWHYGRVYDLRVDRKATWREFMIAGRGAFWALIMPFFIVGGIIGGIVTATEAGAIAVAYALFVGAFVYRELSFSMFVEVLVRSAALTAMAMLVIAGASVLNWIVAYEQIPATIVGFLTGITESPSLILCLLVVFLMLLGMFVETISATILVAPILMPVAAQYGIDPTHFALVMVMTLVYAGVTPPVGGILFITMAIARTSLGSLFRFLPAYLGVMLFVLLLVVFVPDVALFLTTFF
ncbi:TRAP transporter large permease [Consotaella salsifontis]|uniref:TRAP transporter large permease protein n=1 Tax=Consotaella salsifontis TaxID=1365950 RepID=A0A1T4SFN3_9HYPH|nr:TRAP transporter large permease [Consotaella salsifontis]SKA27007.1 C4-dicarboxylate transporter, DctM subunit [Consotaella salsifontis]